MTTTAFNRLEKALDRHGLKARAGATDGGYSKVSAQCPAHHDNNPSLSITDSETRVLMHCHAGCETPDVLAALGLALRDLYDGTRVRYRYDNGREVYRFTTADAKFKGFNQFCTDKPPQLYRAGQLPGAVQQGHVIYFPEGEEDVHAIEAVGGVATCTPQGAGKAHKVTDWSPLRGATVVIIADLDEKGAKHARQVADLLHGVADSIALTWSSGRLHDASDHIAAGYGLDEFQPADDNNQPPEAEHAPSGELVTLSTVEAEDVAWLWPGRLPAGKLALLDGDPSLGKSTLGLDFAAHVSTGTPWPDGADCPAGDVVLMSAEDGIADTIRPRLDAAGADSERVHAFTSVTARDEDGTKYSRPPTLADVHSLHGVVTRTQARLLIVDVLMAYLPGKVDSHRDQDVRGVLHELAALANSTGCAVLLLRHLNKTSGGNALYRGGGSIGIVGAARAGFLVAPDPDDESNSTLVLACMKQNLAPMPDSLNYRLETAPGNHVARVAWSGQSSHGASDLLSTANTEDRSEQDQAVEWLRSYLADGRAESKQIYRDADASGFSKDQIKRAKRKLEIKATHPDLKGPWYWEPQGSALLVQGSGGTGARPLAPLGAPLGESESPEVADEPDREPPGRSLTGATPPSGPQCMNCGIYDLTPENQHQRDGRTYCSQSCAERAGDSSPADPGGTTEQTPPPCHACGEPLPNGHEPYTEIPFHYRAECLKVYRTTEEPS